MIASLIIASRSLFLLQQKVPLNWRIELPSSRLTPPLPFYRVRGGKDKARRPAKYRDSVRLEHIDVTQLTTEQLEDIVAGRVPRGVKTGPPANDEAMFIEQTLVELAKFGDKKKEHSNRIKDWGRRM